MTIEPIIKVLSRTDTGESSTHQSGILISVADGERLFPPEMRVAGGSKFSCEDHTGRVWSFRFYHRAKRSESRITYTAQYIRRYLIRSGDTIMLNAPVQDGSPYKIEFRPGSSSTFSGEENLEGFEEGLVRTARVNQYERDPRNRAAAIRKHGTRCFGCRLEMAETYGEIARGYIHIHHTKPLSAVKRSRTPNLDDLVPLCPNCHAIIHLENPPLTVNKLKKLILEAKNR